MTIPSDPLGPVPLRILEECAKDLAARLSRSKKIGYHAPTQASEEEWQAAAVGNEPEAVDVPQRC